MVDRPRIRLPESTIIIDRPRIRLPPQPEIIIPEVAAGPPPKPAHHEVSKYKETAGDKIIRFCETLKITSGKDTGKAVVLRDWQRNIIKAIYDPIDGDTGKRLIREACLTMARKNGKTSLAAFLVLSHLVGPVVQQNGEIYSAGFRRDQAAIIWRALYNMISVDDELTFYCTWNRTQKTIDCGKFGTTYKAISAEAKSKHGFNPVLVVLDELSQFAADRTLYDVFKTSMGAQDEALLITMSTQAADDISIMSEIIDHGLQVQSGEEIDPNFVLFDFITQDFDDIYDIETWKKANPALGDFRQLDEMQQMADRAKTSPSTENTFRNLYLNQRVASTVSLVPSSIWRLNGEKPQNLVLGRRCYVGLDLSDRLDLTCICVVFPEYDKGPLYRIDVVPIFFTPANSLEDRAKRDRVPYVEWAAKGLIDAVPGNAVDYRYVARKLIAIAQEFEIECVVFDRWRIKLFQANLELEDFNPETLTWMEHGQGFKDMAPAIDCTEEDLLNGRIRHGNHPVLTFNAASTKVSVDPAGNRKFDKQKSTGKIDGMVAMAMALNAFHQNNENANRSVYEKRGMATLPGRDTMSQPKPAGSVWDRIDSA